MQEFQTQILGLLQIVIGGIISIAGVYATIYIGKAVNLVKAKAEHMQNEKTKALVNSTLDHVDDLISTNIVAVENTIKPAILEAIANGTIDKSKLNSLSKLVKENVLNQLGTESKEIFKSSLNDTNGYLQNRIEKILSELKSSQIAGFNDTIITPLADLAITADTKTNKNNSNIVQLSEGITSTTVDIPIKSSTVLPK